jgi:F-type H+-transporting ATPase subunit b
MNELFSAFGIDYKILIAQILNFFLIFIVIYKFLLQPLNKVIQERQNKVLEGLKIREESKKLIRKIKKLRDKILDKAYQEKEKILFEAEEIKKQKLEELMKEISNLREKMLLELNKEKELLEEKFHAELNEKLPEILANVSKKVFGNRELNEEFIKKMLSK